METKVLFYFNSEDLKDTFVELKRPAFKDTGDISKYVSWFWITNSDVRNPVRLSFQSWEGKVRSFEQGVLTMTSENNSSACFDPTIGAQILIQAKDSTKASDLQEVVEACERTWNA
jgi:hypothetical protein